MKFIEPCLFGIFFILASCNHSENYSGGQERLLPAKMEYSYDCLEGSAANNDIVQVLQKGEEAFRDQTIGNVPVTDEDQSQLGDDMLTSIKKSGEYKLDDKDVVNSKLQFILADLLRKRVNPTGIKYSIHLIDDMKTVNAFTFGGNIFITKAIIKKCDNDFQLYAIIGHEIGHNEKGHIKAMIQELKVSRQFFGDAGEAMVGIKKIITAVFNQKSELEADYYGLDLVYMLGQPPCPIVHFWDKMAENEKYNEIGDFMRSHPYSKFRSECLRKHIENNFSENCN